MSTRYTPRFISHLQHNWKKMLSEPRSSRVWYRHKRTQSYLRTDASMVRCSHHCRDKTLTTSSVWTTIKNLRLILYLWNVFFIVGLGSISPHCFPSSKSLSCLSSSTWKGYVTWWMLKHYTFNVARECESCPCVPGSDMQVSLSMNCQPPKHIGRAAQMHTVYIALLFFPSFIGALSLVAYTVWR